MPYSVITLICRLIQSAKRVGIVLCFFSLAACAFQVHSKPIELVFWHAMAGHLGDEVRGLARAFNRSQTQYVIKPVYKGDYVETLTSFSAAFRAHKPPAIVQIFEVGTALMMSPKGVIKPVDALMHEQGMSLPSVDFIQSVREFYSKEGQLMAMPFNLSAPVLYYNKAVLAEVGYNSSQFPCTWAQMERLAKRIKKAGYKCTLTTAYPSWVLIESFLAIHGMPLTQGTPVRAALATPQLIHHLQRLKRWQELHYFRYGGRADDATVLFTSGVCPVLSQSSGAYTSLSKLVSFPLGIAAMPLDTDISQQRHANVAGGAALWAVGGQTSEQYKGIAEFFAYLAKPQVQQRWHEHTGYLPLGLKGIYATILQTSQHPALELARNDLEDNLHLQPFKNEGPKNQIRNINDEMLEALFAGLLTPQEAIEESVARTDHLLLRFTRNTLERL